MKMHHIDPGSTERQRESERQGDVDGGPSFGQMHRFDPRAHEGRVQGAGGSGGQRNRQHPMTPCHLPRGQLYCHDFLATDEERREDVGHDHPPTIHPPIFSWGGSVLLSP